MLDQFVVRMLSEYQPGVYSNSHINSIVLELPFGEVHALTTPLDKLPRLGENWTVQQQFKASFGEALNPKNKPDALTAPFTIKRQFLENLEHWKEWKVLDTYLDGMGMIPLVCFKNTPLKFKGSDDDYYLGDMRAIIYEKQAFDYGG